MIEPVTVSIDGNVKVWDPCSKEVFVDKHNAPLPQTLTRKSRIVVNLNHSFRWNRHDYDCPPTPLQSR